MAIVAGISGFEMTDPQGFTSHCRESQRVFEEAAENTGATFRRLVKQDVPWLFAIWQPLTGNLVVFQLIGDLDGILRTQPGKRA